MGRRTCFWICGPSQYPSQRTHLILGGQRRLDIGKSGAGRKSRKYSRVDLIGIRGCCVAIVHTQFAVGSEEVAVRGAVEEMGVERVQGG
jgi:hypothetical protein